VAEWVAELFPLRYSASNSGRVALQQNPIALQIGTDQHGWNSYLHSTTRSRGSQ